MNIMLVRYSTVFFVVTAVSFQPCGSAENHSDLDKNKQSNFCESTEDLLISTKTAADRLLKKDEFCYLHRVKGTSDSTKDDLIMFFFFSNGTILQSLMVNTDGMTDVASVTKNVATSQAPLKELYRRGGYTLIGNEIFFDLYELNDLAKQSLHFRGTVDANGELVLRCNDSPDFRCHPAYIGSGGINLLEKFEQGDPRVTLPTRPFPEKIVNDDSGRS